MQHNTLFTSVLLIVTATLSARPTEGEAMKYEKLIPALIKVESQGNPKAVGDKGKAFGVLQIWDVVVQDVNMIAGTKYVHADAFDPKKAQEMCRIYLGHYCSEKRLGRKPTYQDAARIWNGGPKGHVKTATLGYWAKVQKHLR